MKIFPLLASLMQCIIITSALPTDSTPRNTSSHDIESRGAAEFFTTPWPKDLMGVASIPYCFLSANERTRRNLDMVNAATRAWNSRAPIIRFYETVDYHDGVEYCQVYRDNSWQWNPDLDLGRTLCILGEDSLRATVGYHPDQTGYQCVHIIKLGPNPWLYGIKHELGHVLGMTHEHQRSDRDRYLKMNLINFQGFSAAMNRYANDMLTNWKNNWKYENPGRGEPRLSQTQATDYKRQCAQVFYQDPAIQASYGINVARDWDTEITGVSTPFDVRSIMLYHSGTYAQDPRRCTPSNTEACVILKWRDPNNHRQGADYIRENTEISNGDLNWVNLFYA